MVLFTEFLVSQLGSHIRPTKFNDVPYNTRNYCDIDVFRFLSIFFPGFFTRVSVGFTVVCTPTNDPDLSKSDVYKHQRSSKVSLLNNTSKRLNLLSF